MNPRIIIHHRAIPEDHQTVVVRDQVLYHLCGYISVPVTHPLFGFEFQTPKVRALKVHGGITFTDFLLTGIHLPFPKPKPLWWFGFACAHALDFDQLWGKMIPNKELSFVMRELESLAMQLKEVKWNAND